MSKLVEWCFTLLLTVFQYFSSRRQLTLFMLSWVSPILGWALKCLAQGHSHEKTQRIQCGSNPGPMDYGSNTLPLSHAGPLLSKYCDVEELLMHCERRRNCGIS